MKEAEITGAIAATDKQLTEVESTLGELRLIDASQEEAQNAEDKDKALKRIKESQNRLTQVTFGNRNAGVQIGISNGPISGISFGGKGA